MRSATLLSFRVLLLSFAVLWLVALPDGLAGGPCVLDALWVDQGGVDKPAGGLAAGAVVFQ
jgi:hypothetical protein